MYSDSEQVVVNDGQVAVNAAANDEQPDANDEQVAANDEQPDVNDGQVAVNAAANDEQPDANDEQPDANDEQVAANAAVNDGQVAVNAAANDEQPDPFIYDVRKVNLAKAVSIISMAIGVILAFHIAKLMNLGGVGFFISVILGGSIAGGTTWGMSHELCKDVQTYSAKCYYNGQKESFKDNIEDSVLRIKNCTNTIVRCTKELKNRAVPKSQQKINSLKFTIETCEDLIKLHKERIEEMKNKDVKLEKWKKTLPVRLNTPDELNSIELDSFSNLNSASTPFGPEHNDKLNSIEPEDNSTIKK